MKYYKLNLCFLWQILLVLIPAIHTTNAFVVSRKIASRTNYCICSHQRDHECIDGAAKPIIQSTVSPSQSSLANPICLTHQVLIPTTQIGVPPRQAISVEDLTPTIQTLLQESGMSHGTVNVISRHTTTAITINERESRLASDMEQYFLNLVPPDERSICEASQQGTRYLHNDIDVRPDSAEETQRCIENGWNVHDEVELQKWRDQEPINAHSHLISMILGSSESIPVVDGKMIIGQWQSVLLVDLDGPRDRTVGVQLIGFKY